MRVESMPMCHQINDFFFGFSAILEFKNGKLLHTLCPTTFGPLAESWEKTHKKNK